MIAQYKHLHDHIVEPQYSDVFMLCTLCGTEYSANRGDYFWVYDEDFIFTCEDCSEPLQLMTKKTAYRAAHDTRGI